MHCFARWLDRAIAYLGWHAKKSGCSGCQARARKLAELTAKARARK